MGTGLLILASRSARRAQLLRQAGYPFIQVDPPFEDPPQPAEGEAKAVTLELANRKAQSLWQTGILAQHPGGVILAADTVCVGSDGRLLGQPHDRQAARQMLQGFIGCAHRVVSGVALWGENDVRRGFADAAEVHMGPIADAEVELYLDTQQWRGKAGGYNLFERQEAGWPIEVDGDPTTVVGLPMRRLARELETLAIFPSPEHPSRAGFLQA